jgi:Fe-S oxidoreductase
VLLPFSPNGKPQHVKGFLSKFEKTANKTASFLSTVGKLNIPMVGADASLVLCYRDEYAKILGDAYNSFRVNILTEWLSTLDMSNITITATNKNKTYKLLAHCSEKTAVPDTESVWQSIFSQFGLSLNITSVGCCGMAGSYGHELVHFENSKGIYNLSWACHASVKPDEDSAKGKQSVANEQILVTGYSCRSQVKRFESYRPKHPIEILATYINKVDAV